MYYSFIFGLFAIVLLAAIVLSICGIIYEKKQFNNGKCSDCNCELIYFGDDAFGMRGYNCAICNKVVWVSYDCVDKGFY